jgi:basic amino acid/polyamine antiporter, APA family
VNGFVAEPPPPSLVPRLGVFDATMVVMGGIIGSGIFINPSVVARLVHTPAEILGAWGLGGLVALAGAFIYAELAARLPRVGGQYAYLKEAIHPLVGFLYGWALLFVINAGGLAAVAVTFARYFIELCGLRAPEALVATLTIAVLAVINCFGVRSGSALQSALMVLKILIIAALIVVGGQLFFEPGIPTSVVRADPLPHLAVDRWTAFGAAMVPVLFAYGGWQTANFMAAELRQPRRDLPRALLVGVMGVIALYLGANAVYLRGLGAAGLAATGTPASALLRRVLGEQGAALIGVGIAISTLGFLSHSMLTMPRVYFAMAKDGLFFRGVAWIHPRTRAPVVAILLQAVIAAVVALSGRYEQILSYVVFADWIFFGLSASCLFVLRGRIRGPGTDAAGALVPGHPFTTVAFVIVSALVVVNTVYRYPLNSAAGFVMIAAGIPAFFLWRRGYRHRPRGAHA